MARTVKQEEFTSKRIEILNAAQKLMFTKGYEKMSIQDILDDVGISSGAFHHYFASRAALLDAFIERIQQESNKWLLPVLQDPHLNAIQKLQGFFDTLDRGRMALKAEVVRLGQFWYTDANALVRLKVDEAVTQQRAPLISEIVRQGVREGLFTTTLPDKAGEVILALLQGMGNTHARLLFSLAEERGAISERDLHCIAEIVATHVAYIEAIERMLGASPNSLRRTDAEAVKVWVNAIRENDPP
jgi:TetR/AcrR family transcriptional regulator, transcriptional repressor for nem operon